MPRHRYHGETTKGYSEELYFETCSLISGWTLDEGAVRVRRRLGIWNTKTRSGLRKMGARLPEVSEKLSSLFDIACTRSDWMYCDVIMIIWLELCPDAVLCRTLLEKGLLERALQLVERGSSITVLQLLSLLARHGDDYTKSNILRAFPSIVVKWRVRWSIDDCNVEFALITLCHCIGATTFPATAPLTLPVGLSVRFLAGIALDAVEDVEACFDTIIHAIPLLIICAKTCPPPETEIRERILDFLAVLVHSKDVGMRCVCTWVFCDLAVADRESLPPDDSTLGSVRQTTHFPELARRDASPGSEQEAIQGQMQQLRMLLYIMSTEENYYTFGVGMAHLLTNGPFPDDDRDFPELMARTIAKFDSWHSLLSEAVEVLRRRQDPSHLDMADTLALEHLARDGSSDAAASHARAVLRRNAEHAYAYAILAEQSQDKEDALQAATKGLRLAHLTIYLRRRMQVSEIELLFAKARRLLLHTAPQDWHRRTAGLYCIDAGMQRALVFMEDVPIDSRELARVVDLAIIHLLAFGADLYTPKLEKIQMLRDIIKSSTRARENLGYEVVDPPARIGHKALAHHFARGYSKWAPLIERFDLADEEHRAFIFGDPSSEADASERRQSDSSLSGDDSDQDDEHKWDQDAQKYSEEYALWWEQRNEPTLASHLRGPLRCSCLSSADGCVQLGPGVALLYACSWCSCRTAMVRKCSRCEDAWYCDGDCQRAHWPQHRLVCRE
ncbi:hypothetical protein K466DRAFT_145215 [Polyporus arcularius HHB13444]|uniref:MYND-type domain-containing protein n=1 Tax=Polyporus arcularius HHB13444 TaxID=1314778 RepID=A0A5C3PU67_9APHY|nr:hypothetical protein K466DRAFT_145215 [Polyporus arcularius HHB13444]